MNSKKQYNGSGCTEEKHRAKNSKATVSFINRTSEDHKIQVQSLLTMSNGKPAMKPRRRPRKLPSPVQRLFETCREVFASAAPGYVPPPPDIRRLRAVLDVMRPVDVGLTPKLPYFQVKAENRTQAITYLHLFECDKFSMGIFCLPPLGVIPLHNHPGMTVFSKLLFGTMHIKSFDWVADPVSSNSSANGNPSLDTSPEVRLAKVKVDSDFTAPCNASILYPADGGNMHCFTAVTACAVLDVLGPPYSDLDGRHCSYYYDFPFSRFSVDGATKVPEEEKEIHAWLQEREILPEDLAVVGAPYTGPEIVENW